MNVGILNIKTKNRKLKHNSTEITQVNVILTVTQSTLKNTKNTLWLIVYSQTSKSKSDEKKPKLTLANFKNYTLLMN